MLLSLHIRDFVIVSQSDIHFQAGFTVFSGETGAGKSILIDALSLALGQRTDAHCIREGAQKADISALFQPNPTAIAWLQSQDIPHDELLLRRTIDLQGKSRAFINGRPCTLTQLRELGALLLSIHGQHAHQQLLKPAAQRHLLDQQGQHEPALVAVQQAWQQWQQCQATLSQAQEDLSHHEARQERLQWQLNDFDQVKPLPQEWEQVDSDYTRLANASSLIEGAAQAAQQLNGNNRSVQSELYSICDRVERLASTDASLASLLDNLNTARILCEDAASELSHYVDGLESDPATLERTETRLRELFELGKKYRIDPEQLHLHHQQLREQVAQLAVQVDIDALQLAVQQAQTHYQAQAQALSDLRKATATTLSQQMTEAIQSLAMQGGVFQIDCEPCAPGPQGTDHIVFKVAGHAGSTPRAIDKIASGGELARLSLALSVIAHRGHQVPTLIFDEVDTGIGGATADIVGQHLRQLGQHVQVLCVTHLPQVAAYGHQHFQVSKRSQQGVTESAIVALSDDARIQEIARMLGGSHITDKTRAHAREMLER